MRNILRIAAAAVALLASASVYANVGVPMVAIFLPPLWLAILPVVAVEAWILSHRLPLSFKRSAAGAFVGNLASTLVGIPLVWMLVASFQLVYAGEARGLDSAGARIYAVTVQSPWLIPYEADMRWMIPAALVVLAVPAYVISVVVEWACLMLVHHRRSLRYALWQRPTLPATPYSP